MKKKFKILTGLGRRGFFNWMSDSTYIRMLYYARFHKKIDLDNPKSFNEKIQWLKLHDRKSIYTTMVDKDKAKEYLSKIIGEEYIISTLGIFDKFSDINFDALPNEFVIKCTHDSGSFVIVHDKNNFDKKRAEKIINKGLKHNGFNYAREWPYKNVKPRIIIEELLKNRNNEELVEYNVFCFNGIPKMVMTCFGDKKNQRYNNYYDISFKKLYFKCGYDYTYEIERKPKSYDKMIQLSKEISKNIPLLRVDFYIVDDKIKIGELTLYHFAGFGPYDPYDWDNKIGEWLDLNL